MNVQNVIYMYSDLLEFSHGNVILPIVIEMMLKKKERDNFDKF